MEICARYPHANSSPRAAAMALALVSAIVLSPLYVDSRKSESRLESRWSSSGLVLPAVVAGLIVAIKSTASSSSSKNAVRKIRGGGLESADCDSALGIGGSSLGLAGILILLIFVLTWQTSVQRFFWK